MKRTNLLVGGALLLASLFTTSCKEFMSNLDEPVSSYLSAPEQVIVPMGETYDLSKVVETINKENAITYESSDPKIATVDKTTGVVTALKDGKVNVTISIEGDEYYKEGKTTVEVWSRDTDLWEPLTFEAIEDGSIQMYITYTLEEPLKYKVNGGEEQSTKSGKSIPVKAGDKVQFYSTNTRLSIDGQICNIYNYAMDCYVYGNIMSLISPDGNWYENKEITADNALQYLFWDARIVKHEKRRLMLPATTLSKYCYANMFNNSSVTEAPELPATTLVEGCYKGMFNGCKSLENAPALNAQTLATSCYSDMFAGCTLLEKAPALPAKDLKPYCYNYMFANCSALTEAPELKAATLVDHCYCTMFMNCSKLNKVTCLATTNAPDALGLWLSGAGTDASVTKRTLVRAEANTNWTNNDGWDWPSTNWYVPTGWTIDPAIPAE